MTPWSSHKVTPRSAPLRSRSGNLRGAPEQVEPAVADSQNLRGAGSASESRLPLS